MVNISTQYKKVMGNYPTGVTVVTTLDKQEKPVGLTVNSFTSVSLNPLLILWCIDKNTNSYKTFIETEQFAVNILAADQKDIGFLFAKKNIDKFQQCEWTLSEQKLPIISGVASVLECKTHQLIEAGDHMIIIGEVVNIIDYDKAPILYHNRKMGKIPEEFYK